MFDIHLCRCLTIDEHFAVVTGPRDRVPAGSYEQNDYRIAFDALFGAKIFTTTRTVYMFVLHFLPVRTNFVKDA